MRRLPALATVVSLAAAALVGVPVAGAAATPAGAAERAAAASSARPIAWGRCADATLRQFRAKCGFVRVPLDYAKPRGATIRLAVSRVRHTVKESRYQGALLLNPGGPGGSGLGLSVLGPIISGDFGRRDVGGAYDWIGFDPRGVGSSVPSLSCDPNYLGPNRPDYDAATPELLRLWQERSQGYARACGRRTGRLLKHMTTKDAARDMDRIRAALGVRRINFYGWSYGTYLGQVYATLFPNRVRRMVLDSNVDPRKVWYAANLDQDRAFERNMGLFFGWLAKHDGTYHLGATGQAVQQRWYDARASLRDAPIAGQVGPDEWSDIFLNAGYAQFLWPDLGRLFADWVNGAAGAPVVDAYRSVNTPGDDNSYAAYVAVTCSEGRWKTHDWVADSRRLSATAPFLTWANTWFNAPCFYWPAPSHRPTHIRGKALGPALLVDETLDAATPYAGSLFVRSIDRRSRLVAVAGGTSHAVSPSGNACVDNKIFAYLKSGSLPPRRAGRGADVTCRAQPQPQPHDASPAFRAGSSATALARLALRGDLAASRHLLARLTLSPARS